MTIRFTRQENGTYIQSGEAPQTKRVMLAYPGTTPFVSDVYDTLPLALEMFEQAQAKSQLRQEWYEIREHSAPELTEEAKTRLKNLADQNKLKRTQEKQKLAAEEADAAAALPGAVLCAPVDGVVSKSVERRLAIQKPSEDIKK